MTCRNVGRVDRIARLVIALALLAAALVWSLWLVIPAAILMATAAVGWCPLYCPLRMTTCRAPREAA